MFVLVFLMLVLIIPGEASYEYAAACVPGLYDGDTNVDCSFIIHCGTQATTVTIATAEGTEEVNMDPNEVIERQLGEDLIPNQDAESMAVRVEADNEVQVLVYYRQRDSMNYNDAFQVPSLVQSGTEYYTAVHTPPATCTHRMYFYIVVSFSDGTSVEITPHSAAAFDITLPEFGTYVHTSRSSDGGESAFISSSSPVVVISGNLCGYNHADDDLTLGNYVATVLPVQSLGLQYVVPKIISDVDSSSSAGYSVHIVATEDATDATCGEQSTQLALKGDSFTFEFPLEDTGTVCECSKNCMVTQFTKSIRFSFGIFMLPILPASSFYTSAFFSTLDITETSGVSVVVSGDTDGTDILLDGSPLNQVTWTALGDYSTAETLISRGTHTLQSVNDDKALAAYVYCHTGAWAGAAGFAVLAAGTEPPPSSPGTTEMPTTPQSSTSTGVTSNTPTGSTTVATPPPTTNQTLPGHTVKLNGTVLTEDGEDIAISCAQAHINALDQKSKQMVLEVNRAIGQSICVSAGQVAVDSSRSGMLILGNKGMLEIDHILAIQEHISPSDVEACSTEIAAFLADHGNWPQPIFPDQPDCSPLVFVPERFDIVGTYWTCNGQHHTEGLRSTSNSLVYESIVSEVLSTEDGSDLDVDCSRLYHDEAGRKSQEMTARMRAALAISSCAGVMELVTSSQSFIAVGNQALFQASFYYTVGSGGATFAEFLSCALFAHDYSLQHDNWGGLPFLPVPPGCPPLQHDGGPTLDDGGRRWTCVD